MEPGAIPSNFVQYEQSLTDTVTSLVVRSAYFMGFPRLALEVPRNLWLRSVTPSLWCVRASVVVKVCFGDMVMSLRRMVSKNSQLMTESERANLGSVLKADAPGTKCLVSNRQRKFAGFVQGSPHDEAILTHKRLRFETNILDVYVLSHQGLFVPTCETSYWV